jgi:hypothetical protein
MDHQVETVSVLERFRKFLGRSPSNVEIERIGRLQETFGLKGNDSIWLLWWILEYYCRLYEEFPSKIQEAATKSTEAVSAAGSVQVANIERVVLQTLKEYKATCEAAKADFTAMAAAQHAKIAAEIAHSLNKEIPVVLKRAARGFEWRNACITVVVFCGLLVAAWAIGHYTREGTSQKLPTAESSVAEPAKAESIGRASRTRNQRTPASQKRNEISRPRQSAGDQLHPEPFLEN